MEKFMSRTIDILLAPLRSYPVSFCFLALALIIPDLSSEISLYWIKENPKLFFCRILLCGGISYLLVAFSRLVAQLSKTVGLIFIIIFHALIFILAFADIYMYNNFGSHLNVYMLQLVYETNQQQTSEFFATYLTTRAFARTFLQFVLLLGCEIALAWFVHTRLFNGRLTVKATIGHTGKTIVSTIAALAVVLSLGFLVYIRPGFSFDWAANLEESRMWDYDIVRSFVFNAYQSGIQFFDEQSTFDRCAQSNQEIIATRDNSPHPRDIVIIIGESYNRHHSSLYGYDHETNPRLSKLPHLYVFDDVISPINGTSPAFKSFMSLASTDDSIEWYDTPLFPAIFKHVGYNVTFFSKFIKRLNMSPWDASAGFINNPKVEPLLFSHRNTQIHTYDEGLIEEYKSQRAEIESDSLNLIFFHLRGQHVNTNQRFPKDRTVFYPEDYDRPELTKEQRKEVADYDNATHYNDSVVCEIIQLYRDKDALILYFADHGDEANDYRPHIGRDFNLNASGAPGLHCQLDVPFLIYLTDSCRVRNPNLEQKIAAATRLPFMLDDLPHLLLDIAGISTPWYKPSRSIINENYNSQRRRIIDGYSTTSPIDYDSICNAYGKWKIGFNNPSYDK